MLIKDTILYALYRLLKYSHQMFSILLIPDLLIFGKIQVFQVYLSNMYSETHETGRDLPEHGVEMSSIYVLGNRPV